MGYKVIEGSEKDSIVYNVIERRSETKEEILIRQFSSKDDAKAFSKHLNFGGGFDGWTPNFFLNPGKISQS